MTEDRPLLGVALMLGFCLLAPFADALAKLLGPHMATGQLLILRFGIQAAVLVPLVLITRRSWRMSRRLWALVACRTVLHIAGIALVFTSLLYLPLADAIAIAYVMPFIALLLGWLVLNEAVGPRRLIACAVGFIGTLLVVQPAFADVGWPALLPLGVAVVFALFMLVTRMMAAADPISMQAVSALMALAVLAPAMLLIAAPQLDWRPPNASGWGLIVLMGLAGTLAHLLMTWALKYAPAATLAPMQYLEIPVATLAGWLLFADLPGPLASLGIAVTVAAGLAVIWLEQRSSLGRGSGPAPRPPVPLPEE